MRIGLIGAGLMGHGMGTRLIAAGHELRVVAHRNRVPVEDLVRRGAREVSSFAKLADGCEVIILCVSNSEVVARVVDALSQGLRPGMVVIDMGTSNPAASRDLAALLAGKGVAFAEAPVTGGPEQAAAGELGALVGADDDVYQRIKPVLACMCARIEHFGPVGAGQTAKLINNYLVLGMVALVGETYGIARRYEIDWAKLYNVMQCGSNNSGVLRKMVGAALAGDPDGYRFSLANAVKDIDLYIRMTGARHLDSDLAHCVARPFRNAVDRGLGERYVSRLLEPDFDRQNT